MVVYCGDGFAKSSRFGKSCVVGVKRRIFVFQKY